jgi:hypothetical protein
MSLPMVQKSWSANSLNLQWLRTASQQEQGQGQSIAAEAQRNGEAEV